MCNFVERYNLRFVLLFAIFLAACTPTRPGRQTETTTPHPPASATTVEIEPQNVEPLLVDEAVTPAVVPTPTTETTASPALSTAPETILLYSVQTLNSAAPTLPSWGLRTWPERTTPFHDPTFDSLYGDLGTGENYPGYFIDFHPRPSPDGRYVLIPGIGGFSPPERPGTGLWLADLQEATVRQLMATVPIAVWNPASNAIAYLAGDTLYVRGLAEEAVAQALFTHNELAFPFLAWSPDGQWLAVITVHQGATDSKMGYPTLTQTLWLVSTANGDARELATLPFMAIQHSNRELTWLSNSQALILQNQIIGLDGSQVTINPVISVSGVQPHPNQVQIISNLPQGLQVLNTDGSMVATISDTPVSAWAVTADGRRLAYALGRSTTTPAAIGIFDLVELQPVTVTPLVDEIDQIGILRWNAVGNLLFFDDGGYNSPIWSLPIPSPDEATLAEPAVVIADGLLLEVLAKPGIDQPVPANAEALAGREVQQWSSASPDGAWVAEGLAAFAKGNDNIYYTELRVKKADGSVEWMPVAGWSRFGLGYTTPQPLRWSPDGRYLYFTNAPVPDGCGLFVNASDLQRLNLADGTIREVLPFGMTWVLAIAPNAEKVVYSQAGELYLLDLATSNYASIKVEGLETDAQWGNFVWSPDSQQVAFSIAYHPCMLPEWSHSLLLLDTQTLTITTVLAKDPRRLTIAEWVDADHLALSDYDGKTWLLDLTTGASK